MVILMKLGSSFYPTVGGSGILALHENLALSEKLLMAGWNRVLEKYSKKRVVSLYEDLYESIEFKR
jgi:hypothetical protein